ncbi:MAG: helix-turn-helix transcriptional regulator [Bacteroidales bacterium]|nr:helix-turn-helix transcriptional regulator [Bacteroidales bacterium]
MKKQKNEVEPDQPTLDPNIYPGLQPMIDTVATFARLSYQWLYVADATKRTFLYISELSGATFGNDSDKLIANGYDPIINQVVPNERNIYNEITQTIGTLFNTLNNQQKKNIIIKFDITSMIHNQPRLLCHTLTPLVNLPNGNPWIMLVMLSPAMHKEAGNLHYRIGNKVMKYDFTTREWHPVDNNAVLSTYERTMLVYAARGYTIDEISHLMYRSVDTVKMYRRNIFKKLGVNNINEALFHAIEKHLL